MNEDIAQIFSKLARTKAEQSVAATAKNSNTGKNTWLSSDFLNAGKTSTPSSPSTKQEFTPSQNWGGGDAADPSIGGKSDLGFFDGIATFGPNVLGVLSAPVAFAAAALLDSNKHATVPSLTTQFGKAIGVIDKTEVDRGFRPADKLGLINPNLPEIDRSIGARPDQSNSSVPSFGNDFSADMNTKDSVNAAIDAATGFGATGPQGDPNPTGTVGGYSVGGLGTFGAVDPGLSSMDPSIGSSLGPAPADTSTDSSDNSSTDGATGSDGGSGGGSSGSNGSDGGMDGGSTGTGNGGHGEGNGGHHAKGGLIVGPGTGTSDSIKANLSNGEYVIPADVVKSIGVPVFDFIRKYGRLPDSSEINEVAKYSSKGKD